jgi:hypothetical protein
MRYAPYDEAAGGPNVIVDGAATTSTVLTISHWPRTAAPPGLEADLSAEMAFAYLARPDLHGRAEVVSNNHFDQDGLVSVFALVDPGTALDRRELLIDVAAAGDFATYRRRDAARASMAIAAFADPTRSPLGAAPPDYGEWAAALYTELLGRLVEICEHPDRYRGLWADEDATLTESERLIASGLVRIKEVPTLDLAVVEAPTDGPVAGGHRFASDWASGLHPMAVHNATRCFTIVSVRGRRYELTYRYEGWVQYRSRRPRPRVDLAPLAGQLSAEERDGGRWVFEGAGALVPRLYLVGDGESTLAPTRFRSLLEAFLAEAPPAWDPYAVPEAEAAPAT